jgi:hypothetical protein
MTRFIAHPLPSGTSYTPNIAEVAQRIRDHGSMPLEIQGTFYHRGHRINGLCIITFDDVRYVWPNDLTWAKGFQMLKAAGAF